MEIEEYYRGHFKIEFMILEKGSVTDSPLWKWVAANAVTPMGNFHKYLIDGSGHIVKNWNGEVSIETIFDDVQQLVDSVILDDVTTVNSEENVVPDTGNANKEEL